MKKEQYPHVDCFWPYSLCAHNIRFIPNSKISQILCFVGLKKGKIDALLDTFLPFFQFHNASNL